MTERGAHDFSAHRQLENLAKTTVWGRGVKNGLSTRRLAKSFKNTRVFEGDLKMVYLLHGATDLNLVTATSPTP